MKKVFGLIILLFIISQGELFANGITIQKVSLTDTNRTTKTVMIRFSITWENSWRDSINWDAAWIFVKFREPKDSVWKYRHLTLSDAGSMPGTGNTTMKFAFSDDRKGVFYYRAAMGSGNVKMDSVKLSWNYGADNVQLIDSVELKLFATEMVYIPTGSFALGDGNGSNKSYNSFQLKNAPNNYAVITDRWSPLINTKNGTNLSGDDDAALYSNGMRIAGLNGLDLNGDRNAELPDFPTGYRSFYCMKYDVTQGQYGDFLNTLSLRDTSLGSMFFPDTTRLKRINPKYKMALSMLDPFYNGIPLDPKRHTVILDSVQAKYIVGRPDRAYGQGNETSYISFADWAGLRPMSEMEYEKAARGPLAPIYKTYTQDPNWNADTTRGWSGFDWAWGNDTAIARLNTSSGNNNGILAYSGVENGTETFNNYNKYKRYFNPTGNTGPLDISRSFTGGDQGTGPYRVGIFATDSSDRITSGASYYGIMDLSKNVSKMLGNAGNARGRTLSYKKHGDGILNGVGQSDANELIGSGGGGAFSSAFIYRTGAVSERNLGGSYYGFRCVRTAPSDN